MADTISPELLRRQLLEADVTLVDTRAAEDFESWHIPGAVNFPFATDDRVDVDRLQSELDVAPEDRIVTICGKGISSYEFAERLAEAGYDDVAVVQDGMEGWSRVYTVAAVPTAATSFEIFQIQRVAKGCLGYVIAAPQAGEAVVVDPTRHTDEFRRIAEDDETTITHVIDTHVHADHVSGGRALADEVDATYHLPADAEERGIGFAYTPLERNEVLTIGDVDLKAIATPGHTAESMSILAGADAVLTGDTLHVDGVGRTELQFGEDRAAEGAGLLYDSIHGSLLNLPDAITVLPGHVDVDDRETLAQFGDAIQSAVVVARTDMPILQEDRARFVERVGTGDAETPPNYERVVELNTGEGEAADEGEMTELELGPNRCAAAAD